MGDLNLNDELKSLSVDRKFEKHDKEIAELQQGQNKDEKVKRIEITLAQQLLLLYYLDLLKAIDLNNKAKSLLLSKILNRNSENIRKNITYINSPKFSNSKIKNVENLEVVQRIFDELKMTEASERVKLDLKRLNRV